MDNDIKTTGTWSENASQTDINWTDKIIHNADTTRLEDDFLEIHASLSCENENENSCKC